MNTLLKRQTNPWRHFLLDGDAGDGGGGGDAGGDDGGGGDSGGGTTGGEGGKTFTQDELNARAGQARAEGRKAAEKTLADQLGVSVEEAKAIIARAKEKDDAEKSDAQKAAEAADAREKVAAEKETAATQRVHDADVRDALRDEGVDKDKLAKVAKLVEVEVGADEATIKAAVAVTKKDFPELFGEAKSGGSPDSDPGKSDGKKKGAGDDAMTRGRERAKAEAKTAEYPILSGQH